MNLHQLGFSDKLWGNAPTKIRILWNTWGAVEVTLMGAIVIKPISWESWDMGPRKNYSCAST